MAVIAGTFRNFYKRFSFVVEINGVPTAGFRSVSEVAIEVAVVAQREGGSLIPNKSPGLVTVPDITLMRGATDDLDMWQWMQQVVASDAIIIDPDHKRTIDIVQQNRRGDELRRWSLFNAWPVRFKAGDWDNEADENVIEEVVLTYDFPALGGDQNI